MTGTVEARERRKGGRVTPGRAPNTPDADTQAHISWLYRLSNDILGLLAGGEGAQQVALCLANELAHRLGFSRVSVAASEGTTWSLLAMSGQVRVDQRRRLPKAMIAVFDQMQQQGSLQLVDAKQPDGAVASPVFTTLRQLANYRTAFTFRITDEQSGVSVALLLESERPAGVLPPYEKMLPPLVKRHALMLARQVHAHRGFWLKRRQEWQVLVETIRSRTVLERYRRGGLAARRIHQVALAVACVAILLLPVPDKVRARAVIEASDQQIVSAPQNGVVATALVRAGDRVQQGDVLATLDQRELTLSVNKWRGELEKNNQEQAQALADFDKVELGKLRADEERLKAELALAEAHLERSTLRAPFDGVVLSGDLSQSLGSAVEQGQTLFKVAGSKGQRLLLEVDDHQIGRVAKDQPVVLRLASEPNKRWRASVAHQQPVAISEPGRNAFRLEARMDAADVRLQPGMEGVAKIRTGRGPAVAVYSRELRQQIRIWMWKLGLWL